MYNLQTSCCGATTGSCHNLSTISKAVRSYLDVEWQRKINEQDVTSVPFSWAKEHPEGAEHHFNHQNTPGKQAQVPRQDNYHDCGLFVLAYLDFWTHAPPDQVDFIDKELAWKGVLLLLCYSASMLSSCCKQWFCTLLDEAYDGNSYCTRHIQKMVPCFVFGRFLA